ncbi:MAG: Integral membrane sensor hybrid histidine kinase, partial [uncultured Thiotrichaceae bacterium]
GIRLLMVDDDPLNQFVNQKLLSLHGAEVQLAGSGVEAIRKLQEQTFDAVLMDVSMPVLDGYETTRQIRANKNIPACPVIALTAHVVSGERERCLSAGMDDYLSKPFEIEELVDVVLKHVQSE